MKAYILKLIFEDITPVVWRRVILPADATFNRLHETIQTVTNFQSEQSPYHSFGIEVEDYFITNNNSFEKQVAGKTVKQSTRIKIDSYLERQGQFIYTYDFGDNWTIQVLLEEIVEDYYFGFPTLLAGEGAAPPEDVGGPAGYEAFLKIYKDPTHSDYLYTYAWAESQLYLPLDVARLNNRLKFVKYKKTEWQHIDHQNYTIISDKYRGSDLVDLEQLENKELILQYAIACTYLYGVTEYRQLLTIYNEQNASKITSQELEQLLLANSAYLETKFVYVYNNVLVHETIDQFEDYRAFLQLVKGKPYYVPNKQELLRYTDDFYYETTSYHKELANMLSKDFFGGSTLMIQEELDEVVGELQVVDANITEVVQQFVLRFQMRDIKQLNDYTQVLFKIANNTRIWENRGHTPAELFQLEKRLLKPLLSTNLSVIDGGKVGRNDPCSCGSGKKYKKCCGK